MQGYWTRTTLGSRLSRRRALTAAAGVAVGGAALSLVGCGDDGGAGGDAAAKRDASGLISTVADTTKQAKAGGVWPFHHPEEPPNLDPLTTQFFGTNFQAHFVYSRAIKYKAGSVDAPARGEIEGDAMEAWELAPDKLTLTFKLRSGFKFEPQAPVNGRAITTDDWKWSWDRLVGHHVSRASFAKSVNPEAPIEALQIPDPRTVVFKLAYPYAPIISLFGVNRGLVVQPREAETRFDARNEMHGSGPWMLTRYDPSTLLEYKRNPNWYVPNRPFIEGIQRPIIKEYAQQVAQFENGTLWQLDVREEDTIPVRRRNPKMLMVPIGFNDAYPTALSFDWRASSKFKDVRVRRALSMLIDRDLWIETFNNIPAFTKEGIDVRTRWHSHYSAGDDRYWLDPKAGKLGEASKFFQFNATEGKALLKAAAAESIEVPLHFQSGTADARQAEVFAAMWQQNGGLKVPLRPLERQDWTRICHTGGGQWDGVCPLAAGAGVDIDVWLDTRVRHEATQYVPYTEPLPKIEELTKAQKKEFDERKRTEIILDIQREMGLQMVSVPYPGIAERYRLTWPWLANYGHFIGHTGGYTATEAYVHYWFDETKRV